ncbi:hypothetical protein U2060_15325, partial [Listeria monocytogenes]|uniref:hypothetical protein n=1 Tax=Listeria monocytogenes TaxID=1639 RepID=UPI002FDC1364
DRLATDGYVGDCVDCCGRLALDSFLSVPKRCMKNFFDVVLDEDWPAEDGREFMKKPEAPADGDGVEKRSVDPASMYPTFA